MRTYSGIINPERLEASSFDNSEDADDISTLLKPSLPYDMAIKSKMARRLDIISYVTSEFRVEIRIEIRGADISSTYV